MKKLIILLFIPILIMSFPGCTKNNIDNYINEDNTNKTKIDSNNNEDIVNIEPKKNLSSLEENGLKIIEEQSFWVNLENWGEVHFISSYFNKGLGELSFYLVDSKKDILYYFPEFRGNKWVFYEVRAVSFRDVNKDGMRDIIIIADYLLGHGNNAAVPFPIASIYFQKDKEFVNITELDEQINDSKHNENIDMLLKFIKGKEINLNK